MSLRPAAAALALLFLAACRSRNPLALTQLTPDALPRLQSDFNDDAALRRIILLISPT